MDETVAAKRNAPHINKVSEFADQIFAFNSTIKSDKDLEGEKKKARLLPVAASMLTSIRSQFNNREMSLVCTKLEEATHWMVEGNAEQVKIKLTEARNWCTAYINVLKTD